MSLAFLPLWIAGFGESQTLAARLWLAFAGIGLPVLTGLVLRRRGADVQLAGVLAMTVLFAPILRINYLPMLVPCMLIFWRSWRSVRRFQASEPSTSASTA